jgi:FlaA1/EpsC-like NDP-sugar epimerase
LLSANGVKEVVIALPRAPGGIVRAIVDECEKRRVPAKIVPNIVEIISRSLDPFSLREVQVEDLLRRPPVKVELAASSAQVRGRRVLITGAGGSIGSELARQALPREPAVLVLLGHGEHSIQSLHRELMETHPDLADRVRPVMGDIQDASRVDQVFAEHRPDLVFHAAAHKHVPLMEAHPAEAVKNNVIGTRVLMDAAARHGVGKFVLISTDKAVRPTSVLGATKRVAEMLVQSRAHNGPTQFVAVRFGNVLGSRGSALVEFKRQIERGGPVTITHQEMTRYFMTIPEAVCLILQAAANGGHGDVFVLDMGEPVRIVDLATDLIRLSGHEPGVDISVAFTGPRPGEKMQEELVGEHEELVPTEHEQLLRVHSNGAGPPAIEAEVAELARLAQAGDDWAVVRKLCQVVRDYRPGPCWQESTAWRQ